MNQLEHEVARWLDGDADTLTVERVSELLERYPYFTLPAVLMLGDADAGLGQEKEAELRRQVALNTPDHAALRAALDPDDKEFASFYPEAPAVVTPSTDDTIDKFINTYGHSDPNEEAVLMRMIFNPTPDYAQVLAAEEERSAPKPDEAPDGSQDQLINDFILKTRAASPQPVEEKCEPVAAEESTADDVQTQHPTPGAEESMLSESLAKIYIGQHRYAKAYEIINNLNLNFPEKSIYFADQLRFLQKLMLAQRYAKDNETDN